MSIIETIYKSVFWKRAYRDRLRISTLGDWMYLERLPLNERKSAEKIMAYYEVHGKRKRLSPDEAAFAALLEFADEFRKSGISEKEEETLASAIYYFSIDIEIPDRWKQAASRATQKIRDRSEKQKNADIALRSVQRNWSEDYDSLSEIQPTADAKSVWKALSKDFEYPQAVAARAGIDLGIVAYWAKLLDSFGVAVRIGTAYGGGAKIRRSPLASEKNPELVAALER